MRKTITRFFTIADYEEEELWLRQQHQNGWKIVKMTPPCFYVFETCEPQDVIYRLDFKNNMQTEEYMQMANDFGWEYFAECLGWLYFRKPADTVVAEGEDELFSDTASKVDMIRHIVRTRMLPLAVIFLCCVIPNLIRVLNGRSGGFGEFFTAFCIIMFIIYVYLIIHCGTKLKAIRDRYLY